LSSLYTGQKLAERDPEKYARIVQGLGEGKPLSRIAKSEKVAINLFFLPKNHYRVKLPFTEKQEIPRLKFFLKDTLIIT